MRDIDDEHGKIILQVIEGSGNDFVTADVFSLSTDDETALPTKAIAGMFVDANSPLFVDSEKGPSVRDDVLRLIIDGVTTTQARIDADNERFMTRSECQSMMG